MVLECHFFSQLLLATLVFNGAVKESWLSIKSSFHQL
jgi:hypothetical protein